MATSSAASTTAGSEGLSPWRLTERGDRWYGRGVVDNKGQHSINIGALARRARDARQARLQRQIPDRDGRGDGLARPARALHEAQGAVPLGRADRLRRAAPLRRAADHLPRLARRHHLRPLDRRARGRPSFGQLGRASLRSGDPARPRHRRASPGRPARSASRNGCRTHSRQRAPRARRLRGRGRRRTARRSIRTGASPA